MNGAPATELGHEARLFADTIAAAVSRHAAADPWLPGAAVSDASPELDAALAEAGWEELADERMLALVGPACAALGRGFAPLAPVDALLGGVLQSGDLARYAEPRADGARLVAPREGRLEYAAGVRLVALPYTDALGVARVAEARPLGALDGPEAERRMLAWAAGSTGYLAGLGQEALRLTLEHARSRIAFGKPLSALEPVQQMLADAATLIEGLVLLAGDRPGLNALVHAGAAAERALGICLQVTGALGFTLEFPLQRAHRRARAARCWADAVLTAWEPAT